MKDKAFARGMRRDAVRRGIELIGLPRAKHVRNVIDGLRTVADVLEARGINTARRRGERTDQGTGARDHVAEYSVKGRLMAILHLVQSTGRRDASRSNVSGYLRAIRMSAVAEGGGFDLSCSQPSSVRTGVRSMECERRSRQEDEE
ncbi:MAG: hypothetical protein OXU64_12570 [Gemmatimonadota bacterium]|nr:hypothetical protein [Gemmatimonadota bacterium]